MELSELRIGNIVQMGGKILTMDVRLFHAVIHGFHGYDPEPIPLSVKWLLKMGFKDSVGNGFCFRLSVDNGKEFAFYLPDQFIRYQTDRSGFTIPFPHVLHVHQLQNLYFTITGKELTVKE